MDSILATQVFSIVGFIVGLVAVIILFGIIKRTKGAYEDLELKEESSEDVPDSSIGFVENDVESKAKMGSYSVLESCAIFFHFFVFLEMKPL